ncbi:MAG: GTP 3',8-cyclase MoaA [Spirochaetales bacterium]|nr:GTP 3',8-cyclase MoaA [Spirochaetales bacterium]
MKDRFKREIKYMRISVTDRCNLRCKYCMPEPVKSTSHYNILRYEEILQICKAATKLGITNFKITGGEPLVRSGVVNLITELKTLPETESVTLTTNGIMLKEHLEELASAGIDGINISLNAIKPELYESISGENQVDRTIEAIEASVKAGIKTKINTVLLKSNIDHIILLSSFAKKSPVDVRFIELMPIGNGKNIEGVDNDTAFALLKKEYPDLNYVNKKIGNGPAEYYHSKLLKGRIGFISANTHNFCNTCNRVRLTSTGMLKNCLCYETSLNLRMLIRNGISNTKLQNIMKDEIFNKPAAHCFSESENITEQKTMNQIGG